MSLDWEPEPICASSVRLMVADESEVIREGLRGVLRGTDIVLVGESGFAEDAVGMCCRLHPDVLVIDLRNGTPNNFWVLQAVKSMYPSVAVLIFSHEQRTDWKLRARMLGASGYLSKQADKETLLDAIRAVARGGPHWEDFAMVPSPALGDLELV